jgi:drug/metabolite transporter (DMT)-like permease
VLTAPQRRFFKVMRKSTFIGVLFLVLGVGILGGHWFYHREWHTPSFIGSMVLMLLGALLLDPTAVKDAMGTLGGAAKDLLPFTKKSDPPPPTG